MEKNKEPETLLVEQSKVRMSEVLSSQNSSVAENLDWSKQIESLQDQEFASMDDVIAALVSTAIETLGPDVDQQGVREFVAGMFETDPELQEQLKSCLNLSN